MRSLEQQLIAKLKELEVKSALDILRGLKYRNPSYQLGVGVGIQQGLKLALNALEELLKAGEKN